MKSFLKKINKNSLVVKNVKIILLAVIFATGFSYVSGWIGPVGTAPFHNIKSPINTTASTQHKSGDLILKDTDGGDLDGTLTSEKITVTGSEFGASYFFNQINIGVPGVETGTEAKLVSWKNAKITFSKLSSANNPDVSYPARVCAGEDGKLSLCDSNLVAPEEPYTASGRITIISQTFTNAGYETVTCPLEYPIPINSGAVCYNGAKKLSNNQVIQDYWADGESTKPMSSGAHVYAACDSNDYDLKIWVVCAK